MKRAWLGIAVLVALLTAIDQLYRWLHPHVDLERATLVGLTALAALAALARLPLPAAARVRPLPGALAILASAVPTGLSAPEREEYVFLLEERAAVLEEKAVDTYLKNLHHAVAADFPSAWVDRSILRLKALRPARPDIRDIRREAP